MKTGTRVFLVLAGLCLLYGASLYVAAQPPPSVAFSVPPASQMHNIPYFLYLRAIQSVFQFHVGAAMIANGLLALLLGLAVFRAGWGMSDPRYRLLGGAFAMLLVQLNPLMILLPLTLGFMGGLLMAPLVLLLFIDGLLSVENWSVFMRAIVLAFIWSLFLWVHLPTGLCVLAAMVPWVLYSRRPLPAIGIFLTVLILGTALFSGIWVVGCALARRWALLHGPVDSARALAAYLHQELVSAGSAGSAVFTERFARIAGWLSPFLLVQGLWVTGDVLRETLKERRAGAADLVGLLSLVILGVAIFTEGKDVLPGAWHLVMLAALWAPLIVRELARKESFYSRGFRWTFLSGLAVSAVALFALQRQAPGLVPSAASLMELFAVVGVAGAVAHALLKKHPLHWVSRVQATLAGAAVGYFIVLDMLLLR